MSETSTFCPKTTTTKKIIIISSKL